jgi:hypothetical protein
MSSLDVCLGVGPGAPQVKTDQRTRALELLCLGVYSRDAALYPLVTGAAPWSLKRGFEANYGVDVWHPKPTNARMIWQRSVRPRPSSSGPSRGLHSYVPSYLLRA